MAKTKRKPKASKDDTPRLWKATQAFINKPKKQNEKVTVVKKSESESIQQFSDRIEAESRKSVNLAAKKLTRKYQKNKEYQTKKKEKKKAAATEIQKVRKNVDVIPFGTQAQEPPKLVVPKQKFKPVGEKRVKLKDMSERDRSRLIAARNDIIQKYRDLKKSKSAGFALDDGEGIDEDDLEGYDQEDLYRKFMK